MEEQPHKVIRIRVDPVRHGGGGRQMQLRGCPEGVAVAPGSPSCSCSFPGGSAVRVPRAGGPAWVAATGEWRHSAGHAVGGARVAMRRYGVPVLLRCCAPARTGVAAVVAKNGTRRAAMSCRFGTGALSRRKPARGLGSASGLRGRDRLLPR